MFFFAEVAESAGIMGMFENNLINLMEIKQKWFFYWRCLIWTNKQL